MPPDVLTLLHDIVQASRLIQQFTAERTIDDFRADPQLRSAVERQFITIGEALQQAIRLAPELSSVIVESRRIINFRNVMVHGYARILPDTVWGVVEKDLAALAEAVGRLLKDGNSAAAKD
jgi:uncharacterized protein with HEPN domain